jgi:hypothetical protein
VAPTRSLALGTPPVAGVPATSSSGSGVKTGASPVVIVSRSSVAGGADVDVVEGRSTGIVTVTPAVGATVIAVAGGLCVGGIGSAVVVVAASDPLVFDVVATLSGGGAGAPPSRTSTTPVMSECRVHRYGKRPACRNLSL